MKKTVKTEIHMFLASTDEVREEREIVKKVVREINSTWGRRQGLEINLITWEDSAYPDVNETPQDVVFEQLWEKDELDIFVAIIWHRLGGGTEKEVLRAYKQKEDTPSSITIMLYFKTVAGKLTEIDPHELIKVNEFRKEISKSSLYKEFSSLEEFEQLFRVNITTAIHDLPKKEHAKELREKRGDNVDDNRRGDEPGLLDLVEDSELYGTSMNSVVDHINELTIELGSRIEERRTELDRLDNQDIGAIRNVVGNSAADLDWYSSEMETDIPKFREAFSRFIDTYTRILEIQEEFDSEAQGNEEARSQLVSMRDSIEGLIPTIRSFRNSIKELPPIARNLNRAKHRAGSVIDKLLDELGFAKDLIDQAVKGMT